MDGEQGAACRYCAQTLEGIRLGHDSTVWAISFSPDGGHFATVGEDMALKVLLHHLTTCQACRQIVSPSMCPSVWGDTPMNCIVSATMVLGDSGLSMMSVR